LSPWKLSEGIHLECRQVHRPYIILINLLVVARHRVLISQGWWLFSTASRRAWIMVSTYLLWFSVHRSWGANYFSKQPSAALDFSVGWRFSPKGPWRAVGPFGPFRFL